MGSEMLSSRSKNCLPPCVAGQVFLGGIASSGRVKCIRSGCVAFGLERERVLNSLTHAEMNRRTLQRACFVIPERDARIFDSPFLFSTRLLFLSFRKNLLKLVTVAYQKKSSSSANVGFQSFHTFVSIDIVQSQHVRSHRRRRRVCKLFSRALDDDDNA